MTLKKLLNILLVSVSISELLYQPFQFSRECPKAYSYYLFEKSVFKVSTLTRKTDGTYNNFLHPLWGSLNQTLSRIAPSAFEDGKMFPSGRQRPSARLISNDVCDSTNETFESDPRKLSGIFLVWGQFFTHDLHFTSAQEGQQKEEQSIKIPKGDPFFDPESQGDKTIPFVRSIYDQKLSKNHPRQQINLLTSWFDGQLIYNWNLRTKKKGNLKLTKYNLLTRNQKGLFVSGDKRVNENIVLTSINTLFVRQHNRICQKISELFPSMNDEQVFTYGKNFVSALIAKITYDDYLPLLLSERYNLGQYKGYEPETDPTITNVFSTVALRFGHFTVPDNILKMNNDGEILQKIKVRDGVLNPSLIKSESDIGEILKGQANNVMKKRSIRMSNQLRNFLISAPDKRKIFLDLAALNIQRGRDHGLPDYNTFRRFLGLKQYTQFQQITSDSKTVKKLKDCYEDINLLDAFIGIIAEQSLPGASIGELGAAVIKHTMHRVRAGDRFWYENAYPEDIIKQIKQTTLADVIKRNTEMKNIQDNVFIVPSD